MQVSETTEYIQRHIDRYHRLRLEHQTPAHNWGYTCRSLQLGHAFWVALLENMREEREGVSISVHTLDE